MEKVQAIASFLCQSPVFNMSLASKELFHSNLISFMLEQNSQCLYTIFSKHIDRNDEFVGIKREKNNLDLVFEFKTKRIVVELKVKSQASKDQLERYSTTKLLKDDIFYLISLVKPDFFGNSTRIEFESKDENIPRKTFSFDIFIFSLL